MMMMMMPMTLFFIHTFFLLLLLLLFSTFDDVIDEKKGIDFLFFKQMSIGASCKERRFIHEIIVYLRGMLII